MALAQLQVPCVIFYLKQLVSPNLLFRLLQNDRGLLWAEAGDSTGQDKGLFSPGVVQGI
jgi:hypothetical protein